MTRLVIQFMLQKGWINDHYYYYYYYEHIPIPSVLEGYFMCQPGLQNEFQPLFSTKLHSILDLHCGPILICCSRALSFQSFCIFGMLYIVLGNLWNQVDHSRSRVIKLQPCWWYIAVFGITKNIDWSASAKSKWSDTYET